MIQNVPVFPHPDLPRLHGQAINYLLNFNYTKLTDAANDAAAAAAGVKVGQLYRSGSALMVRIA